MNSRWLATVFLVAVLFGLPLCAQDQTPAPQQQSPIEWQKGPTVGNLAGMAEIDIPEGYLFTDKKGTQKLLELTHNFPSGNEVGVIVPAANDESWFVIFEFSDVGYVW